MDSGYWIILFFSAVFGGAIGSFLNVVVYRLPNGLSLLAPPSHCPVCKEPIRWFDNVPVFGWIMLGGRCRHCRCWIPIRYPAVEAFSAAMFAAVAAVEFPPIQAIYPFHLTLLCTLLCSALIEVDGNRPPVRLFVFAFVVGIVAPLAWPIARPSAVGLDLPPMDDAMVTSLLGLAAGATLAGLVWKVSSSGLRLGLMCVGLFLGWQAVAAIVLATVVIHGALLSTRYAWKKPRIPASVSLMAAATAWILIGARLVSASRAW